MKFAVPVAAILLLAVSACAPTPRFEWGNYEMALYRYHKQPAQREAYRIALQAAIDRGRASNRIAPGLYAELGYLRLEDGDAPAAISLFEQERQLFPESAALMTRLIEQLRQPMPTAPVQSSAEVAS